jgi:DNA-binding MarR family transcriptional regulator
VSAEHDAVDVILQQWAIERPDVDTEAMGLVGRISRLERVLRPELDAVFVEFGLESWEFDVLATLRRSGDPFELAVGELLKSMMVTSGTMTNRIDRLAGRGLVERQATNDDRRMVIVKLTRTGHTLIDQAVPAHTVNLTRLVSGLGSSDRDRFGSLLRRLLWTLEHPLERPDESARALDPEISPSD